MIINGPGEFNWGNTSIAGLQLSFSSTASKVFKSGLTLGDTSNWNTSSGAVIDLGAFEISGGINFTANPGTTLKSGHPSGLNGNVLVTGTKNFYANATYEFNGSASQVTGSLLPASITGTLRINNSSGVTLSGPQQAPETTLTVTGPYHSPESQIPFTILISTIQMGMSPEINPTFGEAGGTALPGSL